MHSLRRLGLVLIGLVVGAVLAWQYGGGLSAQGEKQDLTRLQVGRVSYFVAGGPNRFRFVKDTKTKTCYIVGVDDHNAPSAITQAPDAACE
jgi:hypothetical protein